MYAKTRQKYVHSRNTLAQPCKQIILPAISAAFLLPLLLGSSLPSIFPTSIQTIELTPEDDAYVINDLNDPIDRAGLRNLNTGDLEFMKIWYAWNVTESGKEKLISVGYMNYDLSEIDARFVESAKLQMYANIVNLSGAARAVDLHLAINDQWDEQTLMYSNAPAFMPKANSSAFISKPDKYYTWDLTELVKQKAGSELSIVITLRTLYHNNEEQVVFYSKEVDDKSKIPKLLIDYYGPAPTMLLESEKTSSGMEAESDDNTGMIAYGSIAGAVAAGGFAFFMYKRPRNGHSVFGQMPSSSSSSGATVEESRFCFSCGKQRESEYNVCPYCGTDFRK